MDNATLSAVIDILQRKSQAINNGTPAGVNKARLLGGLIEEIQALTPVPPNLYQQKLTCIAYSLASLVESLGMDELVFDNPQEVTMSQAWEVMRFVLDAHEHRSVMQTPHRRSCLTSLCREFYLPNRMDLEEIARLARLPLYRVQNFYEGRSSSWDAVDLCRLLRGLSKLGL